MNNVINFQSHDEINNEDIRRGLKKALETEGFPSSVIQEVSDMVMPWIKEAKNIIAKNIQLSMPENLNKEMLGEIQLENSKNLKKYQKDVSNFVLRVIAQLALESAKNHQKIND